MRMLTSARSDRIRARIRIDHGPCGNSGESGIIAGLVDRWAGPMDGEHFTHRNVLIHGIQSKVMTRPVIGEVGTQLDVLGSRITAAVIDSVFAGGIGVGLGVLLASGLTIALEPDPTGFVLVVSIVGFLVYFAYFILLEGAYSRTVGKLLLGIAVTRPDGRAISWQQSVLRNACRIIDGQLYNGIGLFVIVFSADEQRIGDLVAETLVVRVRE